jgi:hypothetical protein
MLKVPLLDIVTAHRRPRGTIKAKSRAYFANDLRSNIHTTQRFWASARASTTLPVVGTQISGSYEWTDYSTIMPSHFYLTQSA